MNYLKVVTIAFLVLTSSAKACEEVTRNTLIEKYQQWQDQDINAYYYIVKKNCFCSPEYIKELKVTVVDGLVVAANYTDSGKKASADVFKQQLTISQWYELALDSLSNEHGVVKITFADQSIYPSNIYIDQHIRRADDEYTITIKELIEE